MLLHCDDCANGSNIKTFLREHLLIRHSSVDDTIKFKQWVSTDRKQHEDKVNCKMFYNLTEHNFVPKTRQHFMKRKESLKQNDSMLVLDTAEIYSFIVQDAARGFH